MTNEWFRPNSSLFFLTATGATNTYYTNHSYHINVANVILMRHIVCDRFLSGQMLAPGSNTALEKP